MATNTIPRAQINLDGQVKPKDAFDRMRSEYEQPADTDLLRLNLDVTLIASTVLGALPRLKDLRPRIAKEAPKDIDARQP